VSPKPLIPRAVVAQDVGAAVDYYAREAGLEIALRFIISVEDAYRVIGARPATGSPRYAHELNLPGLRGRRLKRFPYLVFYIERADHIDVWRVLHAQRDMAAWLGS
jgi:toxin ParE1/3/4